MGSVVGEYRPRSQDWVPRNLRVEFSTQTGAAYRFRRQELDGDASSSPLELAYAITVHKAQGSEFGLVLLVLPNPCRLLSRELLYTALTRQQGRLVILHQGDFLDLKDFSDNRRSETARRLTNLFGPPAPVAIDGVFLEDRLIHHTKRGEAVRSEVRGHHRG